MSGNNKPIPVDVLFQNSTRLTPSNPTDIISELAVVLEPLPHSSRQVHFHSFFKPSSASKQRPKKSKKRKKRSSAEQRKKHAEAMRNLRVHQRAKNNALKQRHAELLELYHNNTTMINTLKAIVEVADHLAVKKPRLEFKDTAEADTAFIIHDFDSVYNSEFAETIKKYDREIKQLEKSRAQAKAESNKQEYTILSKKRRLKVQARKGHKDRQRDNLRKQRLAIRVKELEKITTQQNKQINQLKPNIDLANRSTSSRSKRVCI